MNKATPIGAPVLLYHAVQASASNALVSGRVHNVEPAIFERQIDALARRYDVVSVDDLVERAATGSSIDGLAAITFDDGYRSVFDHALPILEARGLSATVFITTSLIDHQTFWRDKIRWVINSGLAGAFVEHAGRTEPGFAGVSGEDLYRASKKPGMFNSRRVEDLVDDFLKREGSLEKVQQGALSVYATAEHLASMTTELFRIGNHTANHYVLSNLSRAEQANEIDGAHERLMFLCGKVSALFSVPFGGSETFNWETLEILTDRGYAGFLLSGNQINKAPEGKPAEGLVPINRIMPANDYETFIKQLAVL